MAYLTKEQMKEVQFIFDYAETGYCRVHYKRKFNYIKEGKKQSLTRYYCLMLEYDDVFDMYSCTKDGEPECPISEEFYDWNNIPEAPNVDNKNSFLLSVNNFIRSKKLLTKLS